MAGGAEVNKRLIAGRAMPTPEETVADIRALAARIAPIHSIETAILPGLGHGQMFNASLQQACQWAFQGDTK